MSDPSNSNVKIDITADPTGMGPGVAEAQAQLDRLSQSGGKMASQYTFINTESSKATDFISRNTVAFNGLDAQLTKLLSTIDPTYRSMSQLDRGNDLLNQGLQAGLITNSQYEQSLLRLTEKYGGAIQSTEKTIDVTARARNEFAVLGREFASGNMSRVPGSLAILAQGLSPLALGIAGVTAVVAAAAYAWNKLATGIDAATAAARENENQILNTTLKLEDQIVLLRQRIDLAKQGISGQSDDETKKISDLTLSIKKMNEEIAAGVKIGTNGFYLTENRAQAQKELNRLLDDENKKQALNNELKALSHPAKNKVDKNESAVTAMQNEEFAKQMALLGVLPEQVKVYELAMRGATTAQINEAQAAANSIMASEAQIKARQVEEAANRYTEKSTYDLGKARATALAGIKDLDIQEQIRNADMLTGIQRDQTISDLQLKVTLTNIKKQHDLQVAALQERRAVDDRHHALTLDLEQKYQDQFALLDSEYQARITDAQQAAAEKRLKNEESVANISANIQAGHYANAMDLAAKMTAGLASHNRAMFEINKAASLARATISGYTLIMDAAKDGASWGGYIGAIAEGALAAIYVAAQLDAINSTQFGGGMGTISTTPGGGGVPSQATSPGTPVLIQPPSQGVSATPVRTVNINMQGGQNFYSADAIRNQLIPALNDAAGDGVVITVNGN